ncbi:MAG: hypothetical protein M1834_004368 [Cirrosporium novae-zelandiae]|nr:MAG: hypothetical protein M1834_004368 [Cirrosporium novae-zelandiae]
MAKESKKKHVSSASHKAVKGGSSQKNEANEYQAQEQRASNMSQETGEANQKAELMYTGTWADAQPPYEQVWGQDVQQRSDDPWSSEAYFYRQQQTNQEKRKGKKHKK